MILGRKKSKKLLKKKRRLDKATERREMRDVMDILTSSNNKSNGDINFSDLDDAPLCKHIIRSDNKEELVEDKLVLF